MMTMLRNCLTDIVLQVLFVVINTAHLKEERRYLQLSVGRRNPRFANFRRLSITNRLVCINGCSNQRKITKGSAPDSQNRLNTWLGKDQTDRPWIIEESSTMSVRTKNWKYIEPNDGPAMITWGPKVETGNLKTPQLYDMRVREYEKENLADQHPEIVYEMQNILRRVRK